MALEFPNAPSDGEIYNSYIYVSATGTWQKLPASANLDDLGDVVLDTPAEGDVLGYNGSQWVNQTPNYRHTFLMMGA